MTCSRSSGSFLHMLLVLSSWQLLHIASQNVMVVIVVCLWLWIFFVLFYLQQMPKPAFRFVSLLISHVWYCMETTKKKQITCNWSTSCGHLCNPTTHSPSVLLAFQLLHCWRTDCYLLKELWDSTHLSPQGMYRKAKLSLYRRCMNSSLRARAL